MRISTTSMAAATAAVLATTLLSAGPTAAGATKRPTVRAVNTTVTEHAGTAKIRIRTAKPAAKRIRIHFHTVPGSAHAGSDYVSRSGTVTIARHHKSATIRVRIVNDKVHEGTERFTVRLKGKGVKLKNRRPHVTIVDDDPAPHGSRLHGTITYHLKTSNYYADMELGSPGNQALDSTLTMHVSLARTSDGRWVDDGTSSWSYAATGNLWFRRGEGVDTQDNGFPYGCADNPLTYNYYRRIFWYGTAGNNAGSLINPPSSYAVPDLHQAFLTLTGYDPSGTGTPVLRVVAHLRPDRFETRIADGAHICDPDTVQQPNPIVHQGPDDAYLDVFATDSYHAWIPRSPDTGGLRASYQGTGLSFTDSDTQESHGLYYNDQTGHYNTETTDVYAVSGSLTLG